MSLFKKLIKRVLSFIIDIYYTVAWRIRSRKSNAHFLNAEDRDDKIVVSLTSFPGRIGIVSKTIKTLLLQKKVKPDLIILWLSESQFSSKEESLPNSIRDLMQYGLTIRWCEDIRSYKKLIPALSEYSKDILVTADDDVYYAHNWLEKLYYSYLQDKKSIHCNKATKFTYDGNTFSAIAGGKDFYSEPSYLNKLVGVGGVLYPANSLNKNVLDTDCCMKYLSTNDDIWFWCMAVLNETKIRVIEKNVPNPIDVYGSFGTEKLSNVNDNGEKLFWKQFNNACELFPNFKDRLIQESKKCSV